MTASTVSVTANPRRRSSAVSDAKQGIDIVNDAAISPNLDNKNVVGDNNGNSGGNNDLSHSMRGEAVVERSKDNKKSSQLPNSNAPVRPRNKKTTSAPQKPPKPRWQTLLRVLTKNILVLLVLVGLIQMGRKLMINSGNVAGSGSLMGFSDMEGRIAGVESSLKTTSKMLQVQVDVVDKKIESEVGNLRREMNRKVEDKSVEIGAQLSKLEERSDNLEMDLVELRSKSWSKEDLVRLYDEFKRGDGGANFGLSFDEIRSLAREVVDKEIEKHAADGLGRVDYALGHGGAVVVSHSDPLFLHKGVGFFNTRSSTDVNGDAVKMLNPSFGEPGQCFPLKGSSGYVAIRLRTAIVPEAITLEHVAKSVAYDRSSAPKQCRVSGWFQGQKTFEDSDKAKRFPLTDFTYDLDKSNAQTFNVLDDARSAVVDTVMFKFSSNHGSPTHTCIYRLRVHGHEPESVPVIPADS